MPESTWKLYNATGSNATECDGSGTRHDNNITGGKATGNSTGTGGKATKKLTGGKATDNDSILLNLSKILMRLIRYEKKSQKLLALFECLFSEKNYRILNSKDLVI